MNILFKTYYFKALDR